MGKKSAFLGSLNQKGQALLIIVLVMVVALTVGLSVASRTIINLRNSSDQVSSQQALSSAEAGIERVIATGNSASVPGSYSTSITAVAGSAAFLLNGGNLVPKDDAVYVWITPYTTAVDGSGNPIIYNTTWSGNLTLYWGDSAVGCNNAAIEVSVINGPKTAPTITRYAIDPCSSRGNNFTAALPSNFSVSGRATTFKTVISISNGLLVRVNPIYSSSYISASGVPNSGNPALPNQGSVITSTGTANSTTTRKVTVFQGFPEIPAELFPYSFFSP